MRERTAIGLSHAAAFALAGWFLMIPPASPKSPSQADANVPLSKWQTLAPFDDAASCEKIRGVLLNFARKKVAESADAPQEHRTKVLLKYSKVASSRCVDANDPGLKGD